MTRSAGSMSLYNRFLRVHRPEELLPFVEETHAYGLQCPPLLGCRVVKGSYGLSRKVRDSLGNMHDTYGEAAANPPKWHQFG